MRVLIVGLPLFAERLKNDLQDFDEDNSYYFLDTYYNKRDRFKALFLIPFVDVVYSINGALDKSRVFDLAFKMNKKVMMTWVGTDVIKAKRLNKINQTYLKKAHHYCEVDWIKKELTELKINAQVLNFFNFEKEFKMTFPVSEGKLKVLSYISKGREEYYGWNEILNASNEFPNVEFVIVGTDRNEGVPENLKCLGWVEDMGPLFEECHCTIRFVEHDGLSGFVLESLFRGKHVIYSEPLDYCLNVRSSKDVNDEIRSLELMLKEGSLKVNMAGHDFVQKNFNRKAILTRLIKEMKK